MYVIDTNVISELRKTGRWPADARVVAWFSNTMTDLTFLSAITVLELQQGVLRIGRRDPDQGRRLQSWLDHSVLPSFTGRILPIDVTIALRCARLHIPDPRPERDALIAATALVHGMTVVTRNVADFVPMGVSVVDPWAA